MRIFSLFVTFCFSLNVMASTGTIQELERHMDEYQYALSIEWDQKDQTFYDAQTKIFFDNMNRLIKEEGLTKDQIIKLVEAKTKSKETLEALKLKLSLLSNGTSVEELTNLVREYSKDLYSEGASWNGQILISAVIWAVVIGALAYTYWFDASHECIAYENQYTCRPQGFCFFTGDNTYSGYHYDVWGNWVAPGYTCHGSTRNVCGNFDVCVEFAKK